MTPLGPLRGVVRNLIVADGTSSGNRENSVVQAFPTPPAHAKSPPVGDERDGRADRGFGAVLRTTPAPTATNHGRPLRGRRTRPIFPDARPRSRHTARFPDARLPIFPDARPRSRHTARFPDARPPIFPDARPRSRQTVRFPDARERASRALRTDPLWDRRPRRSRADGPGPRHGRKRRRRPFAIRIPRPRVTWRALPSNLGRTRQTAAAG